MCSSDLDHCVYMKNQNDGSYIILLLYVDDMLVVGSNMQEINVLKIKLVNTYPVVLLLLSLSPAISASTYPCRAMFEPPNHNS